MEKNELLQIVGGVSITGTFISSIYKAGNLIFEMGRSLGSAIRRAVGGQMCSI